MLTIFLPILFQVGLTIAVASFIPGRRARDMRMDRNVAREGALNPAVFAEDSRKVANNYDNQFQTPVLFYVGGILALLFGATGTITGVFMWGFVASRIVHTTIHCTTNHVPSRFIAFAFGLVMLIGLWLVVTLAASTNPPILTAR